MENEEGVVVLFDKEDGAEYRIICAIGEGEGRVVYKARCLRKSSDGCELVEMIVVKVSESRAYEALKSQAMDYEGYRSNCTANLPGLRGWYLQPMWATFHCKGYYCVVLQHMNHGSLLTLISHRFPRGFPEHCILSLLRDTLRTIAVIHEKSDGAHFPFHRQISAAHIHVCGRNGAHVVKLANAPHAHHLLADRVAWGEKDFSVCRWAAAPEVYGGDGATTGSYGAAADIWLIGVTALELAYGGLEVRGRDDLMSLIAEMHRRRKLPTNLNQDGHHCWDKKKKKLKIITSCLRLGSGSGSGSYLSSSKEKKKKKVAVVAPKGFEYRPKERIFTKEFVELVLACLAFHPPNRPTAHHLIRHPIFDKLRHLHVLYL